MITEEKRDMFIEDLLAVFNKHNIIVRDYDLYGVMLVERPAPSAVLHVDRLGNEHVDFYYEGIADNTTFHGVVGLLDSDNNEINYEGYKRQEATFKSRDNKLVNTTQVVFPQCPPHTNIVAKKLCVYIGKTPFYFATLDAPLHLDCGLPITPRINIGELVIK